MKINRYNPKILNGKIVEDGSRSSMDRYKVISSHCKKYKRPISVLDLGAAEGFFIQMLANEYKGFFTAIECDPSRDLFNTFKSEGKQNIYLLEKRMNLNDLKSIAEVQYFDIVLALSVVHHFQEPFQEVVDTIMSMCNYCFFEHPNQNENLNTINIKRVVNEPISLNKYNPKIVTSTNSDHLKNKGLSRSMFLLENKKPKLITRHYEHGRPYEEGEGIEIHSNFSGIKAKYLHRNEKRDWHLGLNLRTFFLHNGNYPTLSTIFNYIDECEIKSSYKRLDLSSHNAILDKGKIILIDQNDKDYNASKYLYNTNKLMFKISILLNFPTVKITDDLSKKFMKFIAKTNNGMILVAISIQDSEIKSFSTFSQNHSINFKSLDNLNFQAIDKDKSHKKNVYSVYIPTFSPTNKKENLIKTSSDLNITAPELILEKKSLIINEKKPLVSICTVTFNRPEFLKIAENIVSEQDYPHHLLEWIIVDDSDGDNCYKPSLSCDIKIQYKKLNSKVTIGEKRNISHKLCSGEIVVYFDDDDYYPPSRVSNAVKTLIKSNKLIAGSSALPVLYLSGFETWIAGPFSKNHATAATFAFKKELLDHTAYNNKCECGEEKEFLKGFKIPMEQLDPFKTIIAIAHKNNTYGKEQMRQNPKKYRMKKFSNNYLDTTLKKIKPYYQGMI